MRKNKLVVIILLAVSFIAKIPFVQDSFAAYPYLWTVDGEEIWVGNSNTTGTASWQKDNEANDGGVLTLNNYHGGQIKIECRGTERLDQTFRINLIGDNYITVDNGIGILALEPITFSGNGTLTIEAAIPISSNEYMYKDNMGTKIEDSYSFNLNNKIIIKTSDTATNPNNDNGDPVTNTNSENDQLPNENAEIANDNTKTNDATNDKNTIDWKLITIIMISVTAISIIIIIILLILLAKKDKKQTTTNNKSISDIDANLS